MGSGLGFGVELESSKACLRTQFSKAREGLNARLNAPSSVKIGIKVQKFGSI